MSNTLLDSTYDLLKNAEGRITQREIAEGAGVGYWWFIKFAQRSIQDPGAKRVQKIHDYLIEHPSLAEKTH
jgi:hypothetical protein